MPIEANEYKKTTKRHRSEDKVPASAERVNNFSLASGATGISALYAATAGSLVGSLERLSDWRAERRARNAVPDTSRRPGADR